MKKLKLHWNANGLPNDKLELETSLQTNEIDAILSQ